MLRKQMTMRTLVLVIAVGLLGAGLAFGIWPFSSEEEDQRVNINTADQTTLAALPGVGEANAEAIVEYRNTNGPFETVEDVKKVFGIDEQVFTELEPKITVKEEEQSSSVPTGDQTKITKGEPGG
jgi:comEA protein